MAKFFYVPFAEAGTIDTVPDLAQPNGSVNYADGYGPDYQLPLAGGGAALPIERSKFNGLMNDITGAIQIIQEQGVFSWIGNVPELGTNFPYPINALVYYMGSLYQSLTAANIDVPGATANWANISGNLSNTGVPIGSIIDYAGIALPANYLDCDGSTVSRTTYVNLFNAISSVQTGTLSNGTPNVTGLTSTANFYIGMDMENAGAGTGVPFGTTVLSIVSGTAITMSQNATVSGAQSMRFMPWGAGDGSITFKLPDAQRQTRIGSGGTKITGPDTYISAFGGTENYKLIGTDLAPHTHANSTITVASGVGPAGVGPSLVSGPTAQSAIVTVATYPGNIGVQTATSLMQPSLVVMACIKYQ